MEYIGKFHPNKIAQFFSRPFTFESVKPTSYIEKYWKYLKGGE